MKDRAWEVPSRLKQLGTAAWLLVGIGVVTYFGFQALRRVSVVVIACVVALFVAAVLWPLVRFLQDRSWPPALAALTVMIGAFLVLGGILAALVPAIGPAFGTLGDDAQAAAESFRDWLVAGPLGLTDTQIDDYWETITEGASEFGSSWLLGGATAAIEVITGFFLMVIVVFFVLKDGRQLINRLMRRLPEEYAGRTRAGITTGWQSLALYMRGLAVVGAFDAVLIGLGLWIVGVPLVIPLAVLVFFGAFIPLVGAFVSGLLAVAIAFVNGGLVDAAIILAVVVVVQQIEGDVIYPIVFGQTLRVHPLLVLLGVAVGGLAFGLFGAFIAVPLMGTVLAIHEEITDEPEDSITELARG